MAPSRSSAWILCALIFTAAQATPDAAFPFNSQVPTVARINTPYNFELSASTFTPNTENFTYSLSQQPAWLSIDSATRTLQGTPGAGDVGSKDFVLTAADSTGASSMTCTLIVSGEQAPVMGGDIAEQLAKTANLSSVSPPVVTLLPSTAFRFDFQQSSFIDIVSRKLWYYATLTDHTPLPSWISFDADTLVFSGTAPELSAFPQSWSIDLIVSDVQGFAGTKESFTIAIGQQQLAFVPEEQVVNATAGQQLSFTTLQSQLFLNGQQLDPKELKSASATNLPEWLNFDQETLAIEGTVPDGFDGLNISVIVVDQAENTATAVIELVLASTNGSLFEGQIGTLTAKAGEDFSYQFPDDLFSEDNLDLTVALPTSASWLSFDKATRTLEGTVPSLATATNVQATLVARPGAGEEGQSQVFTIDIKSASVVTTRTASSASSSATASSTPIAVAGLESNSSNRHLSGGIIALIVVLSILGAILLLAFIIWFLRRRRRRQSYVSPTPSKKDISRPMPRQADTGNIIVTTELDHDVEKYADSVIDHTVTRAPSPAPTREVEPPPQINLNIPTQPTNRRMKWSKRFSRISQVSSLGVGGEEMLRQDSNIPEWGQRAPTLNTPHDSFSVPAEIARVSRHLSNNSNLSPSKRALRRLRDRHRSRDSGGLGISSIGSGGIPRHSSKRINKHRRGRSSFGGLSTARETSVASMSTRGTSLLSTRPSEFPVPPESSHSTSLSMPTLSLFSTDNEPRNRKSIRLVERSDSIAADSRPFDQKRQSFIHNRASRGGIQSPLFAHGSRTSSSNAISNGSVRRSRASKSILATYSESSSLEPQGNEQRISQQSQKKKEREHKRLSTKVKTAFGPSFPRVVTRSTLYSANEDEDEDDDWTTSESTSSGEDWRAEMHKPRHERSWVLPNEASPTPEPPTVPPSSRRQSGSRNSWRAKSSSPLSSNVQTTSDQIASKRRSPLDLVSADSLNSRIRPMSVEKRPVSVEDVKRLSSMKAEQATAGDEQYDGTGLRSRPASSSRFSLKAGTAKSGRSDMSGPAFL